MTISLPVILGGMLFLLLEGFKHGRKNRRMAIILENWDDPTKAEIAEAVEYVRDIKDDERIYGKRVCRCD